MPPKRKVDEPVVPEIHEIIKNNMYKLLPRVLDAFGEVRTEDFVKIQIGDQFFTAKDEEFYDHYGFKILKGLDLKFVDEAFVAYWREHFSTGGVNVRQKQNDKDDTETQRKNIKPIDFLWEKLRDTPEDFTPEDAVMLVILEDFVKEIKKFIKLTDNHFEAYLSFLFSLLGGGIQEFHQDIQRNSPDTHILWFPLYGIAHLWVVPKSHIDRDPQTVDCVTIKEFEDKYLNLQQRLEDGIPIKIVLREGEVLKMKCSLLHAGDVYTSENMRAHVYVERKNQKNIVGQYNVYSDIVFDHDSVLEYFAKMLTQSEVNAENAVLAREAKISKRRRAVENAAHAREVKRVKKMKKSDVV